MTLRNVTTICRSYSKQITNHCCRFTLLFLGLLRHEAEAIADDIEQDIRELFQILLR